MQDKPKVSIIAAIGRNRELGSGNKLLWHIPDDLKRFKTLTLGHPVIMGRKTFESIVAMLGKPLPGRTNIVVTRNPEWKYEEVVTASSIEEALSHARTLDTEEVCIGGGADLWKQSLPFADTLHLTLIDDEKPADTYFPEYEHMFKEVPPREEREWNGLKYAWVDFERVR